MLTRAEGGCQGGESRYAASFTETEKGLRLVLPAP